MIIANAKRVVKRREVRRACTTWAGLPAVAVAALLLAAIPSAADGPRGRRDSPTTGQEDRPSPGFFTQPAVLAFPPTTAGTEARRAPHDGVDVSGRRSDGEGRRRGEGGLGGPGGHGDRPGARSPNVFGYRTSDGIYFTDGTLVQSYGAQAADDAALAAAQAEAARAGAEIYADGFAAGAAAAGGAASAEGVDAAGAGDTRTSTERPRPSFVTRDTGPEITVIERTLIEEGPEAGTWRVEVKTYRGAEAAAYLREQEVETGEGELDGMDRVEKADKVDGVDGVDGAKSAEAARPRAF